MPWNAVPVNVRDAALGSALCQPRSRSGNSGRRIDTGSASARSSRSTATCVCVWMCGGGQLRACRRACCPVTCRYDDRVASAGRLRFQHDLMRLARDITLTFWTCILRDDAACCRGKAAYALSKSFSTQDVDQKILAAKHWSCDGPNDDRALVTGRTVVSSADLPEFIPTASVARARDGVRKVGDGKCLNQM